MNRVEIVVENYTPLVYPRNKLSQIHQKLSYMQKFVPHLFGCPNVLKKTYKLSKAFLFVCKHFFEFTMGLHNLIATLYTNMNCIMYIVQCILYRTLYLRECSVYFGPDYK